MSGLRFAMLTTFYPPNHFGGDAIFIQRLTHALARRGHTVDVIHDVDAHTSLSPGPEPAAIEEPEGVTTHPLRSRHPMLSCLATQQLGRPLVHGKQIETILDAGDFDVVHFHNISLIGGPKILRYGKGIKLYMAHEHWLVCPMHVLWRHGRELCDAKQCFRCTLSFKRPPQLWRYTGMLEREAEALDVIYSPSSFSAGKHAEFGFSRELEVLPYFLPNPDTDPDRGADAADTGGGEVPWERPYFLFVGRLEKIKGLQDVIPHFGADAPADLLVVGSGDYRKELEALAKDYPRVHFLGRRPPEEIRPFYRAAIASLVPSLCYETFGIVVLESYREGTPVIARDLGPLPEIVRNSKGGLLFSKDEELGTHLRTLAADTTLRDQLGESGRRALIERWSESVVLRGYFAMIRRVAVQRAMLELVDRIDATMGAETSAGASQRPGPSHSAISEVS